MKSLFTVIAATFLMFAVESIALRGVAVGADLDPDAKIPHVDDETSLVDVKANPRKFTGKEFRICGRVRMDDYFNYSYGDASDAFYSIRFNEVGETFRDSRLGEYAYLYLRRDWGKDVSAALVKYAKEGGSRHGVVARVHVRLNPDAYEKWKQWDMFEILDVQFINDDADGWGEWVVNTTFDNRSKDRERAKTIADQRNKIVAALTKELDQKAAIAKRAAEFSTWADASGKFTVSARLEKFERGVAFLERKDDGRILEVRLSVLSKDDQMKIRNILKARKTERAR